MSLLLIGVAGVISYFYAKSINLDKLKRGPYPDDNPPEDNNGTQFLQRQLNKNYKSGAVKGLTQQLNMTPYTLAVEEHALPNRADYKIPINARRQAQRIHNIFNLEEDPRLFSLNRVNAHKRGFRYKTG